MGAFLFFLSYKYNDELPFSAPPVIVALCLFVITFILFVLIELYWAKEPVLAPFLLKQKVPVLIGLSNGLVSLVQLRSLPYSFLTTNRFLSATLPLCISSRCSLKRSCWPLLPLLVWMLTFLRNRLLTVRLGTHLLPNSVAMSFGSLFAGSVVSVIRCLLPNWGIS